MPDGVAAAIPNPLATNVFPVEREMMGVARRHRGWVLPALALALPFVALIIQLAIWPVVSPLNWFLFYPAVLASAWIGGLRIGVIATFVSVGLVWWFFVIPPYSLEKAPKQLIPAAIFAVLGVTFAVVRHKFDQLPERARVAEKRAQLQGIQANAVFNAGPDATLVVDSGGHIVRANQQAQDLFGYAASELVGKSVDELLPPGPKRELHVAHRAQFAANPSLRTMGTDLDLIAQRADGREFPIDVGLAPFHLDGEPCVIATVHDASDRKRLEADLRRQLRLTRILGDASTDLSDAQGDLAASMDRISQSIATNLGDTCGVFVFGHAAPVLTCVAWHARDPAVDKEATKAVALAPPTAHDEPIATVFRTGHSVVLTGADYADSLSHLPAAYQPVARRGGADAAVLAPIHDSNHSVVGVVTCRRFSGSGEYLEDEVAFIEAVADRASLAWQNTELLAEISAEDRKFKLLAEISNVLLQGPRDPTLVMNAAARGMSKVTGDGCIISMIGKDGDTLVPVAFDHADVECKRYFAAVLVTAAPIGQGFAGGVAASGQPLLINHIPQEQLHAAMPPEYLPLVERCGLDSMVIVPMIANGRIIGTLSLVRHDHHEYAQADVDLALEVVARLSTAVIQSDLHKQATDRERLFRAAFDDSPIGMAMLGIEDDNLGDFIDVNEAFCGLTGRSRDSLIGTNERQVTHPDDQDLYADWLIRVQHGVATNLEIEKRFVLPDGGVRWVQVSASVIRDEAGRASYALKHVQDVTAVRGARIDNAATLSRSLDDREKFADMASHDLQTPLRTVAGYTQVLAASLDAEHLTQAQRDMIDAIVDGVNDMTKMIRGLLEFARLDADRAALKVSPQSVRQAHDDIVGVLARDIAQSAACVTWVGHDELVLAHDESLRHVLLNLIQNAITYHSPDRTPIITTTARKVENSMVEIAITDNGIGVPPEQHARVFDLFRQLKKGPGIGMGLPMVRRMLELQGGSIEIRSSGKQGTTMLVWLPEATGAALADTGAGSNGARSVEIDDSRLDLRTTPDRDDPARPTSAQHSLE